MLLLALATILGAVTLNYVAADQGTESDPSAITTPDIPETPTTFAPEPIADPPIPDPLDERVAGFSGSLVLAVAALDGLEVWGWSSGASGVLERSIPVGSVFEPRFDASGSLVAAIRRRGGEFPSLRLGQVPQLSPVFWGAHSFAWHSTAPGAIAWVSQWAATPLPTLHTGEWVGDGVYFRPVADLEGFDVVPGGGDNDRLVAFDDLGFVLEKWRWTGQVRRAVVRLDPDGNPTGEVDGVFAGIGPNGDVAVTNGPTTRILGGPLLELRSVLPAAYSSLAWTADGRIAAAHYDRTVVDLIDGVAVRSVDIGQLRPSAVTWSQDGRFAVFTGNTDGDSVLTFVDSASLDTTTLFLTGHVLSGRGLP